MTNISWVIDGAQLQRRGTDIVKPSVPCHPHTPHPALQGGGPE